jgi:Zn-dependent alcohol dehydrogenase
LQPTEEGAGQRVEYRHSDPNSPDLSQTVKCSLGHADRTDLGREFGATDAVAERGEEGLERVRKLTGGDGTHTVLECVGLLRRWRVLLRWCATATPSAASARRSTPRRRSTSARSCATSRSPAGSRPRAYIEELMPDVLERRIQPGRVFDRTVDLEDIADGYRAMADRKAIKVIVEP